MAVTANVMVHLDWILVTSTCELCYAVYGHVSRAPGVVKVGIMTGTLAILHPPYDYLMAKCRKLEFLLFPR